MFAVWSRPYAVVAILLFATTLSNNPFHQLSLELSRAGITQMHKICSIRKCDFGIAEADSLHAWWNQRPESYMSERRSVLERQPSMSQAIALLMPGEQPSSPIDGSCLELWSPHSQLVQQLNKAQMARMHDNDSSGAISMTLPGRHVGL